jgi:hypothetical protein
MRFGDSGKGNSDLVALNLFLFFWILWESSRLEKGWWWWVRSEVEEESDVRIMDVEDEHENLDLDRIKIKDFEL